MVERTLGRIAQGLVAVAAVAVTSGATATELDDWEPITDERLLNPEPGDWLSYRRTYDVAGFSPDEPILWSRADGTLAALFRDNGG